MPQNKMPQNNLTQEQLDKLTIELTKYAEEGASDDELREFKDAYIQQISKEADNGNFTEGSVEQPGQPTEPLKKPIVKKDLFKVTESEEYLAGPRKEQEEYLKSISGLIKEEDTPSSKLVSKYSSYDPIQLDSAITDIDSRLEQTNFYLSTRGLTQPERKFYKEEREKINEERSAAIVYKAEKTNDYDLYEDARRAVIDINPSSPLGKKLRPEVYKLENRISEDIFKEVESRGVEFYSLTEEDYNGVRRADAEKVGVLADEIAQSIAKGNPGVRQVAYERIFERAENEEEIKMNEEKIKSDSEIQDIFSRYRSEGLDEFESTNKDGIKYKAEYTSAANSINKSAEFKLNKLTTDYNSDVNSYKQDLISQIKQGVITPEEAEKQLGDYNKQLYSDLQNTENLIIQNNNLNLQELTTEYSKKIEGGFKEFLQNNPMDSDDLQKLNDAVKRIGEEVDKDRFGKLKDQEMMSIYKYGATALIPLLGKSFLSTLGRSVSGAGTFNNIPWMVELGDEMNTAYSVADERVEDWSDLANIPAVTKSIGRLAGSALPSILVGSAVSASTGGLGTIPAMALIAGTGWMTESIDMAGNIKRDVIRETGSLLKGEQAAGAMWEAQLGNWWTYVFDGLPYVGKALRAVPSRAARIAISGTESALTETLQETFQTSQEQQIMQTVFDETEITAKGFSDRINQKLVKETFLEVAPGSFALGGGGRAVTEFRQADKLVKEMVAKTRAGLVDDNESFIRQKIFASMNQFGKNFTNSWLSTLQKNGSITEEDLNRLYTYSKTAEGFLRNVNGLNLTEEQNNTYFALSHRANELYNQAESITDDKVTRSTITEQANALKKNAQEFLNNPETGGSFVSVQIGKGPALIMNEEQAIEFVTNNPYVAFPEAGINIQGRNVDEFTKMFSEMVEGTKAGLADVKSIDEYSNQQREEGRLSSVDNTLTKVNNAEYINDNEIDSSIDQIFDEIDRVDGLDISDNAKESIKQQLLSIAEILDNHEFRTKTETRKVTPKESAEGGAETKREIPKKSTSKAELAGVGTVSVTFTGGNTISITPQGQKGRAARVTTFTFPENFLYTNEQGDFTALIIEDAEGNEITINDPEIGVPLAINNIIAETAAVPTDVVEEFVTEEINYIKERKEAAPESREAAPKTSTQVAPTQVAPTTTEETSKESTRLQKRIDKAKKDFADATDTEGKVKAVVNFLNNATVSTASVSKEDMAWYEASKAELEAEGYVFDNEIGRELSDNEILEVENRRESDQVPKGVTIIERVVKPRRLVDGKQVERPIYDVIEGTGTTTERDALAAEVKSIEDSMTPQNIKETRPKLAAANKALKEYDAANFTSPIQTEINTTTEVVTEEAPVEESTTEGVESSEGLTEEAESELRKLMGLDKSKRKASREGNTEKDNQRLDKVERAVDLLEKSLSKVMPGIVISVAEDSDQFALFSDEQKVRKRNRSQGLFTRVDGTYVIVLNPDSVDVTTVFHEGLHAMLKASGLSNDQARAVTGRMMEAVKKTATKKLQRELEEFTDMYPTPQQNEEYIAELIGILANNYNEQNSETKSLIRRWLEKLAEILGLKPKGAPLSSVGLGKTDAAIVDALNFVAQKMSRGKVLSKEDVTSLRMGGPLTVQQVAADMRMDEEQDGIKKSKTQPKIDISRVRSKYRPGKRVSKGVSVKGTKDSKTITETEGLSTAYVKKEAPEAFIKNANILAKEDIVSGKKKFGEIKTEAQAQEVYDIFTREVANNLIFLTEKFNQNYKDISTLWYDGANILAQDLSKKYDVSVEQVAGMIASLSPQKDWYQNVRLAELTLIAYKDNPVMTQDMVDFQQKVSDTGLNGPKGVRTRYEKSRTKKNKEELDKKLSKVQKVQDALTSLIGTKIKDADPAYQAYYVRLYTELNVTKDYNILRPDGEVMQVATKKDGTKSKVAWGSYVEIGKAVSMYNNGSQENITKTLGEMHKIRNFYNNIIDPMSKDGDVTIDTHAVAAGLLKPLSGNSREVGNNFGTGTSNSGAKGVKGVYYAYLDAYALAAKELDLLPRQVQSITWEAVRGLYTDSFKRDSKKTKSIEEIWERYRDGKITINKARDEAIKKGGGINNPTWAESVSEGVDKLTSDIGRGSDRTVRSIVGRDNRGGIKPETESIKKSKRQTREQRTDKDLKNNWLPTPIKSMRDSAIAKSKEVMQRAAIKLLKGEITQEKWVEVREKNSPINKIGKLFQASTLEHMNTALGKKAGKLMAPIPKDIRNRVGARLDIPSYIDHNAWVVTLHDGKGPVISYRNAVRLKNVEFVTDPNMALMIASGLKSKSTFARMVGEMVDIPGNTAEEQGLEAQFMIEDIMNNKEWTQVGMNPFRQSWFWNRETGLPVVAADEVIQVGGLVYAKNVKEASPNDKRFEVRGRFETTTKDGKTSYKLNIKDFSDERITDPEGRTVKFSRTKPKSKIKDAFEYGIQKGIPPINIKNWLIKLGYTEEEVDSGAYDAERIWNKDGKKVKNWFEYARRSALSARKFRPQSMFLAQEAMESAISAELRQAKMMAESLNSAINRYKSQDKRDELIDAVDEFMRDAEERDFWRDELPDEIAQIAEAMRIHIDSLSLKLVEVGAIKAESSRENILKNIGVYMNRSFEVFDNKNWKKEVSDQVITAAQNHLREVYYNSLSGINELDQQLKDDKITESDYNRRKKRILANKASVKKIMDRDGVTEDEALTMHVEKVVDDILTRKDVDEYISFAQSVVGKKDLSSLKRRKDIPPAIRALMGEYTDPGYNYAMSIFKIANLVENQKYLTKIRDAGLGVWLFEDEAGIKKREGYKQITFDGDASMNPLDGLYAPEAVADAFNDKELFTIISGIPVIGTSYKTYLKFVGGVKYSKTILSFGTHAKNVIGNMYFMAQNGYLDPREYQQPFMVLAKQFAGKELTAEQEAKMDEWIRAGIIGQGASIGEIKAIFEGEDSFEKALSKRIDKKTDNMLSKGEKGVKWVGKKAQEAYQYEDDMFKIVAYEKEKLNYSKILFDGKSYNQLDAAQKSAVNDYVAEIIKNILPNYSRIGGFGKFLKAVPVAGTFISFQLEAYRTAYNTVGLAMQEIKGDIPGISEAGKKLAQKRGAKRLASIVGFQAFKYGMIALLGLPLIPGDDDEDGLSERIRMLLPFWDTNSDIAIQDVKPNGNFTYVSVSASDPYGSIFKVVNATTNYAKTGEGFSEIFGELAGPFVSEDILLNLLRNVSSNENDYGGKIWRNTDTAFEKSKKISLEFYKTFEPGSLTSTRKIVQSENKLNEVIGQFTGFKLHEIKSLEQAGFKFREIQNEVQESKKAYNSVKYNIDDYETQADINKVIRASKKAMDKDYKEAVKLYQALISLGVSKRDIRAKMDDAGISSTMRSQIARNSIDVKLNAIKK